VSHTPLAALCGHLALLSLVAVGGANSVVPEIHRFVVDVEHLMTSDEFARWFALAQAAPGPNVLIVALIGWKVAGVLGAVLALVSMCAPSCALTYVLSEAWDRFRGRPWLAKVAAGLAPLTTGLILASGYLLGRGAPSAGGYAITLIATAVAFGSRWNPLWILGAAALAGAAGLI
jgi:chromate transporter